MNREAVLRVAQQLEAVSRDGKATMSLSHMQAKILAHQLRSAVEQEDESASNVPECKDSRGHLWRCIDGTISQCARCGECAGYGSAVAAAPEPVAWLIEYTAAKTRLAPAGIARRVVFTHNAIADYRDIDPNATSTPLYR